MAAVLMPPLPPLPPAVAADGVNLLDSTVAVAVPMLVAVKMTAITADVNKGVLSDAATAAA
jgi:hypothetical protein